MSRFTKFSKQNCTSKRFLSKYMTYFMHLVAKGRS
jgi:hypothetical protein